MQNYLNLTLLLLVFHYVNTKEIDSSLVPSTKADCSTFSSCISCVSSRSQCSWCTAADLCTSNSNDTCPNDMLVTSVIKPKPNTQSGPDYCPQFNAFGNDNEILVASGTKKSIKTKIRAIGDFLLAQTRSNCKFYMEGRVVTGNAQIFGETIYCDVAEFKTKSPKTTVKFDIFWNKTKPYANPDNVHVLIYNCHEMANNCAACFELASKYNCGWCKSTASCEVANQCAGGSRKNWLKRSETCP